MAGVRTTTGIGIADGEILGELRGFPGRVLGWSALVE
jgi:hypothetical protein